MQMLEGKCLKYELVGSRVTCDPAPTDTDQDVLVLTTAELWAEHLGTGLAISGFQKGGSDCGNQSEYLAQVPMSFQSFTLGDLNLIITFDPEFYRRFLAATGVAKHLNLLQKEDRVLLFQAVLYGNEPFPKAAPIPEPAPFKEYMRSWWVYAKGAGSGCVEAMNEAEAQAIGSEKLGAEVTECDQLPYPASPRLHIERPDFPSFCFEPHKCKGRSSCPQRYSCTE